MQQDWLWHVTYLSNVHVWQQGSWSSSGHFWTLALEQQFYLLWFPVVVILPRRWLMPVVMGLLIAAPIFRSAVLFGASPFIDVLLPAQADALAAGALLTLALRGDASPRIIENLTNPIVLWSLLVVLFSLLSLPAVGLPRPDMVAWIVLPSLIALSAFAVIATAVTEPDRLNLMSTPLLTKLGTVSYGLYIYHYFVPQFVTAYLPALANAETASEKVARLCVWIVLSVGMAAISWHLIERPLLRTPRHAATRSRSDQPDCAVVNVHR